MTQEEKAKAYDEAIKKAKKDLQVCEQDCLVAKQIFRYFPELAESDDEKTRKVLVDYFKRYKEQEECGINTFYGIATDNILAWLEKQKPIQNINKEDEEVRQYIIRTMKQKDINVPMVQKALAWLEKQNSNVDNANKEYWRGYREGKQEILDKYAELEKQGEQNLAEWSKEDESIALGIEQIVNCASLLNIVPEKVDKIRTWLKFLKERIGG